MGISVYEIVTDRIIRQLEQGTIPWRKSWVGVTGWAVSASGRPYSILNQLLLDSPGYYYTWNQVKKLGGRVRDGEEKNYSIVTSWFEDKRQKKDRSDSESDSGKSAKEETHWVFRYYRVYREDQCEGIPVHDVLPGGNFITDATADEIIQSYVDREHIRLEFRKQNQAYYAPGQDMVVLPVREQFSDAASFHSVAFHELTHSTGHQSRLNRFADTDCMFGSEDYSKEELVAEIGAASMLNLLGIETPESFQNSAAYINGWLEKLKSDKRFIISAARQAEKAVAYIRGEQVDQ